MSDTPRTDKLFDMVSDREQPDGGRWGDTPSKWSYEAILDLTDFCRTLERELAAIKSQPVPVEPLEVFKFAIDIDTPVANFVLKDDYDTLQSALQVAQQERDAFVDLNHNQFLELEYLRPIFKAAENLLFESEEYDFDDGLGKGAAQTHWDALADALEPATDAIEEVVDERKNVVDRLNKAEARNKRMAELLTSNRNYYACLHSLIDSGSVTNRFNELLREVDK